MNRPCLGITCVAQSLALTQLRATALFLLSIHRHPLSAGLTRGSVEPSAASLLQGRVSAAHVCSGDAVQGLCKRPTPSTTTTTTTTIHVAPQLDDCLVPAPTAVGHCGGVGGVVPTTITAVGRPRPGVAGGSVSTLPSGHRPYCLPRYRVSTVAGQPLQHADGSQKGP